MRRWSDPQGGGPDPQSSVAAGGAGYAANQNQDTFYDNNSDILWDVGSAADSVDFLYHDKEENVIHIGEEKDGFIAKSHMRVYKAIKA